mgnify:CR=1 FL=1
MQGLKNNKPKIIKKEEHIAKSPYEATPKIIRKELTLENKRDSELSNNYPGYRGQLHPEMSTFKQQRHEDSNTYFMQTNKSVFNSTQKSGHGSFFEQIINRGSISTKSKERVPSS